MKLLTTLAIMLVIPVILCGQKLSDAERDILTLQDQRSLGGGKLTGYLASTDAHLRFRALVALANIQDTSTVAAVSALLRDGDVKVRAAAAFALGQIGTGKVQDSLLARLREEPDSTVLGRIIEALGRIGDENALDQVVELLNDLQSAYLAAEQASGVTRFALRGIKNERSIWFCFELAKHQNPDVRWNALVALWRSAPHGLLDVEIAKREADLAALAGDPSGDVRMNLATLLGKSSTTYSRDLLRAFAAEEGKNPNWQVQVQLVKSFGALCGTYPELTDDVAGFLLVQNDHVKIATLQVLEGLNRLEVATAADTTQLRTLLNNLMTTKHPSAELVRGEAFVAMARLFPSEIGRRSLSSEKDLSVRERTKVIEALSYVPSGRSLSIVFMSLDDPNVRIAMAAWDFIRRFFTPATIARIRSGGEEWGDARATLYRKTMFALGRHDMAITHLVSNALADTTLFNVMREGGYADSLVLALKSAYEKLASPDDVEAMQSALTAMGRIGDQRFVPVLEKALGDPDKTVSVQAAASLFRITGSDYRSKIPQSSKPLHSDYDWSTLESLRQNARAVIKTNKGVITLQLLADDAPFTVLSFSRLVKKGFYGGLSFHRVVPNFVIQGGDPRGDGWGGPGYAIRSEYSFTHFSRGSVGIASAGKDTEGCQLFITHLPTPHLDGRFTVFARVVAGQDVVDQIQVGDTIESIILE